MAQHGDGLIKRPAVAVVQGLGQRQPGRRFEPVADVVAIVALFGPGAQVAEHRAGLHRGELVLVAEQHQACMGRQGVEQRRHHVDVDHRRFVHRHHVQRQRVEAMMMEVTGIGSGAEQPVQGRDLVGNRGAHLGGVRQRQFVEGGDLVANGFAESRRRLAGGGGQAYRQGGAALSDGLGLQQRQQTDDGGGLAGAGAAGDHREGGACAQRTGELLGGGLVGTRIGRGKQRIQHRTQAGGVTVGGRMILGWSVLGWMILGWSVGRRQPRGDGAGDPLFVAPVAA